MSGPSHTGGGGQHTRTRNPNASNSSATVTTTQAAGPSLPIRLRPGTLRLRAEPATEERDDGSTRRRIQWAEDVIDNEGMGKKSSKGIILHTGQA